MSTSLWQELPYAHFLTLWYLVDIALTIANYVSWVRFTRDLVGGALVDIYLAFTIIGTAFYFVGSATCFLWSLRSDNKKQMRNKIILGVFFTWFFSDLPLFIIDFWVQLDKGFYKTLQALSFMVKAISFFLGSFALWFWWMWFTAKILQRRVGDPLYPSAAIGHAGLGAPAPSHPPHVPQAMITTARRREDI
eukprot:NODE_3143_length_975_cov_32.232181_g2620_i0.p1 GENE.NODE_3143_length_975_cov_32.232181_g2620_i0~~NODE_3143_length_975_cov_32.232181_g2620_i0.p1  ORF type:complete len:192 (+),score=37.90 NODE_3143_length_975_cov_32.232181_g2620_i0:215-790(+)